MNFFGGFGTDREAEREKQRGRQMNNFFGIRNETLKEINIFKIQEKNCYKKEQNSRKRNKTLYSVHTSD